MSETHPLFSILVLNYKGMQHLPACFASLVAQDFKDWELVFVDNRSEDGSPDWVRTHYPDATVIESPGNLGFAGGNNIGLPKCRGEWVFFLNNDTILEPGCLKALAREIARRDLATRVFAPLMLQWDHPERIDSGGDELYTWGPSYKYADLSVNNALFAAPREVALACGGASVFEKKLLDRIGGFDEDFFLLFEDVDLSLRARHAGAHILLVPDARVLHKGSASIGRQSRIEAYYSNRNLYWAKIKNYPFFTLLKYAPAELLTTLLSFKGSIVRGMCPLWIKAHMDLIRKLPLMLGKRRKILAESQIDRTEFERWLRKGWVGERLRLHLGRK